MAQIFQKLFIEVGSFDDIGSLTMICGTCLTSYRDSNYDFWNIPGFRAFKRSGGFQGITPVGGGRVLEAYHDVDEGGHCDATGTFAA